jgi:hypothetical protein
MENQIRSPNIEIRNKSEYIMRPLYQIALDIGATWQTPSPHAKAYLKAMRYLVDINDSFAAGNARRIVRCFLLYSKDWQGADAERIKEELREIGHQPEDCTPLAPRAATGSRSEPATIIADVPAACELCALPIKGKYVHGRSVWGVTARMCPACHYYIGVGFEAGNSALYQRDADGYWRHLHGTPPATQPGAAADASQMSRYSVSGRIPLLARAKRGQLVRALVPHLRQCVKVLWGWTGGLGRQGKRGQGKRDAA